MALQITGLKRVFLFKDVRLDDPNPKSTTEQVKALYSDTYPELATATLSGPFVKSDCVEYKFSEKAGSKG